MLRQGSELDSLDIGRLETSDVITVVHTSGIYWIYHWSERTSRNIRFEIVVLD